MHRRTLLLAAATLVLTLPSLAGAASRLVAVNAQPGNPAFGFGSVWVPSSATGLLDRVDPKTMKVVARIRSTKLSGAPENQYFDSVALSSNAVWHASDLGNVVVRINPQTNKVVAKVALPGRPDEVAAGPLGAYVGLFETNTVVRISASTNRIARKRNLGALVMGMAVAGGKLWALSGDFVEQLDPVTLAVRKKISVKSSLPFVGGFASTWWLGGDATTLCVGNLQQNAVSIIDPATAKVVKQVALPSGRVPFSVAAANGSCWVTNDSVVFLVGGADTKAAPLPHNGTSTFSGVVAADGGAWVTLAGSNLLTRVTFS